MYKLWIVIVMCCAFFPWGSAAPKTLVADPTSQTESNEERNDRLQEELDSQENILSKVGGNVPFYLFICIIVFMDIIFLARNSND